MYTSLEEFMGNTNYNTNQNSSNRRRSPGEEEPCDEAFIEETPKNGEEVGRFGSETNNLKIQMNY
jgi:hypothetical protein